MFVRYLFFVLALFYASEPLFAQDQLTLANEKAVWVVRHNSSDGINPPSNKLSVYQFKGDTIISDTIYKKLMAENLFQGGVREEGKKVFLRSWSYDNDKEEFQSVERLIYDFSLNKGDTITLHCSPNNGCKQLLTLEVDSILYSDNKVRRRQLMKVIGNYQEPRDYEVYWIEGIGSTQALLEDDFCFFNDREKISPTCGQRLVCYSLDGLLAYSNSDSTFNECPPPFIISAENTLTLKNLEVKLYPNPASSYLSYELSFSKNNYILEEISILNLYGQVVFSKTTNKLKKEIDIRHLPKGLFSLHFRFRKGISVQQFFKN